jgi:Uma2 family endonuclease
MAITGRALTHDAPVPARWTVEDYHRATDAGAFADRRIQLIGGEIVQMPPMSDPHILASNYLERLFARLRSDADDRIRADKPIVLNEESEPEPDLVVLRPGAPAKPSVAEVLLVIEVSQSSRRRDLGTKLDEYLASGVRELWIIDLVQRCAWVYRGGLLIARHEQGSGAQLVAPDVPEVSLDLDALFRAAGVGA